MADAIISSFQRHEVKFYLTPQQRQALAPVLKEHFAIDCYGKHTISNIYYDTDNFEITRNSIEKPVYKEKLRLRAYGTDIRDDTQVFLELKKKYKHVVYKRRIALPLAEAEDLLAGGPDPADTDPQITHEIRHFLELHHPQPKVYLSYQRIALAGRENPDLRITLDQELLWRTEDVDLRSGAYGSRILPRESTLMEIKVPGAMPLYLSHALSQAGVYHTSFSKIGTCYTQHILPELFTKKVVTTHV